MKKIGITHFNLVGSNPASLSLLTISSLEGSLPFAKAFSISLSLPLKVVRFILIERNKNIKIPI